MRSRLVIKASDCQCRIRNSPGFDPSILRHSRIWGAADEAVLKTVPVHRKIKNPKKFPPVKFIPNPGFRIPDPRSQTHISESWKATFGKKLPFNSLSIGSNFSFLPVQKLKQFWILSNWCLPKKDKTTKFLSLLFLLLLLDPGSGMGGNQDAGETSRIRNTVFNKLMDLRKLTQNKAESRRFQPDRKKLSDYYNLPCAIL